MANRARRLKSRASGYVRQQDGREPAARPSAHERGYDRRWRAARRRYLSEHGECRICQLAGRAIAATVVDHIRPHRGDKALFWSQSNWQPLCKRCHDAKTRSGQ